MFSNILENTKFLYQKSHKDYFQAKDPVGWVNLKFVLVETEKKSCNVDIVEPYKERIQKIFQELILTPDQVYGVDENDFFVALLKKRCVHHKEVICSQTKNSLRQDNF